MDQVEQAHLVPFRYRYEGSRLTPAIMADLATALVQEPVFQRSTLGRVREYHLEQGGAPTETDIKLLVKKTVTILARKGLLEGAGKRGWWQWRVEVSGLIAPDLDSALSPGPVVPTSRQYMTVHTGPYEGEGTGCIYVYYFPTYKELAARKQEARWPVKIGMTNSENFCVRVFSQQGTVMPESPIIAYVRRTNSPRKLEQGLHAILHCRGQQLANAPGSEWFLSSPEEIRDIVEWVCCSSAPAVDLP